MTTLDDVIALAGPEQFLMTVATLRADGTIQASLVNAGVMPHPTAGRRGRSRSSPTARPSCANLRARPTDHADRAVRLAVGDGRGHRRDRSGPTTRIPTSTPNGSGACSARSSPPPAAPTTTGTPTTPRCVAQHRTAVLVTPTRVYSN